MSESAIASDRFIQFCYRMPVNFFYPAYNHLCNSVAWLYQLFRIGKVDENNFQFSAIIRIHGSRRIQTGDPMLQRQSAARSYLGFIAWWKLNENSSGNQLPFQWPEGYRMR